MTEKNIKLLEDFPSISTEKWMDKINMDLKGKDFNRALVWKTLEGFNVNPFYRNEDLDKCSLLDLEPGQFPYLRGNNENNDWNIRQDILVKDLEEANKEALGILNRGITSLGFIFDQNWCKKITEEELDLLLKNITLDCIELNFAFSCKQRSLIESFVSYLNKSNYDLEKLNGSLNHDPIGKYIVKGRFHHKEEGAFGGVAKIVNLTKDLPNFQTISVNARIFKNAGSTSIQELGYALSIGAEYLSRISELGIDVDTVASKIKFNFAVGGNYFIEIAKLRAARVLWAKIVKAFGAVKEGSFKMKIHSETSDWNKTVYDPYVNMLRTQTEAMSAILGGTESLVVKPFDSCFRDANTFSKRIARNQQLLLKEECHFDKVVDPAGGSYYIENLTESIINGAWDIFIDLDNQGGFVEAFKKGTVQSTIKETSSKRDDLLSLRRENLLGTNQFPNFNERIEDTISDSILSPIDRTAENAEVETIKTYRGAQVFEGLRYSTDKYAQISKRPKVFMLTIGNLAFRKARAQFSCNFFAVAGFDVIDNNGFATIEEGYKKAQELGADIIVLCSSDDEYSQYGKELKDIASIKDIIVIAGAPTCMEELKQYGITQFIHVKSNILNELKKYQKQLGIE